MPLPLHERYRRLHPHDRKPDQRREAQRDRDRVLYTSALRRLGHVTQVVSPTEGIVFHNRLTHTHEVAQIGRRIAERLTADEEDLRKAQRLGGIDPDVVETAALVHDLGHPPYGHAGEQELNYLVSVKHGIHDGYKGNAQSFRIVTKLAMRHRRFPGLNLTRASLNASLKYPWFREDEEELIEAATERARLDIISARAAAERVEQDLMRMSRERLLPDDNTLEKVARYEAHLSRLFHKALHELEALQVRRLGGLAPLARVDVEGIDS